MEVRPGTIPDGWKSAPLGQLCGRITTGKLDANAMVADGDYPFFTCARESYRIDKYAFDCEALLVSGNGANVGYVHYYNGKFNAYQRTYVLSDFSADVHFLRLFLDRNLHDRIRVEVNAGNTPYITMGTLTEMGVVLPTTSAEQRAIATALSDVDGLLGGLDRLIAKKRDLKQAAMQQLLTGQTRLPGWDGAWEVKKLKQVAEISTGINKPLSEMGSGALYVTVQDLYDKTSIRTERLSRIKVSPSEIETRGLMVGDIVFGKSSVKRDGIGYPSQFLGCDEPVVFSGFTYRARARQGITDPTFLFYTLREEKTRRWLIDNSQASALTNINQTIADAIPVQVPPSVPEQTAIAEVLTEMDGELAVLEQRREKTRALKQAMMQELLTGRIRLV